MAPDQKKKKLPLIDFITVQQSEGYELYIIFNYYLFTKSEIVAPYKTRW